MIFPVLVTVYTDRTFTFILKTPPASVLLKRAANNRQGFLPSRTATKSARSQRSTSRNCKDQACRSQQPPIWSPRAHRDGYGAQHGPGSRGSLEVQALRGRRDRANDQEGRQERGEGAQAGRSAPVQASGSGRTSEEKRITPNSMKPWSWRSIWALIQSIPTPWSSAATVGVAQWTRQNRSRAG